MESFSPLTDTIDELIAPLEQSLAAWTNGCGELRSFADGCQHASDMLEEIGEDEAATLTQTLGLLSDVLDGLSSDNVPATDAATGELVAFVQSALQSLRGVLSGESTETESPFINLLETAYSQWGEHLQLLSGADEPIDGSDDRDASWDDIGSGEPSGQVDLILSALHESKGVAVEATPPSKAAARSAPVASAPMTAPTSVVEPPGAASLDLSSLDPELLEAYLEDAGQCLASMERALLDYENDPTSADPIEQLCRDLHTLKGASASVGFKSLASQLHNVEEQLERHGDGADVPVDLAMNCVDVVRGQIETLQPKQTQVAATSTTVSSTSAPTATAARPMPTLTHDGPDAGDSLRVRTAQIDRLTDLLADVVMWRSRREKRLAELDTAGDELSRSLFRLQAIDDRIRDREYRTHRPADGSDSTRPRYMAELLSDVREITQQLRQTRQGIADENRAISQFIHQFRQELVQIRRMPLAGLFQRLHRSVRDAARVEGKDVRLEIIGEQTGLDRGLQEKLYEPLLHLVRNAVSHGIESVEKRVQAGKSPVGTITLEAYGSPHVLIIEVRDDGGGLDYDAIRRRGLERGLIFADRPVSKAELARLIFRPGFSTREATNEIAGRGVGMNVVEAALDRCQCHIETESEAGRGTRFRLTIPLRSVIEHTLLFRCCGQSFALPMDYVKSASADRQPVQPGTGDATYRLADLLKIPAGEALRPQHWIEFVSRTSPGAATHPADRQTRENRLCIGVDEILGPEEVVVRPLPPLLRRHPHLCGMTLSGAGEIVLLLDGRRLAADASTTSAGGPTHGQTITPTQPSEAAAQVLVVDDSLSARKALVQRLRGYGFGITEAGDGAEAMDLLRTGTYDAVFSDLEMPHLGGFDLLNEMTLLDRPAPPCVIVTTRCESETRQRAKSLGAAGFLSKPVDADAVDEIVSRLGLTTLISNSKDE